METPWFATSPKGARIEQEEKTFTAKKELRLDLHKNTKEQASNVSSVVAINADHRPYGLRPAEAASGGLLPIL